MKIVSWTIVNNEIDFIKDLLDYHLSWIDGMYILDTGSNDGTLEFLKSYKSDKLVVESYHTSYSVEDKPWEEMTNPFPEVEVRNYAIQQARQLNPDWLVQLDGDEVFLAKTRQVIEAHSTSLSISHSTLNLTGDTFRMEWRRGLHLYDPHARIWNASHPITYFQNPDLPGKQFHCIPGMNNKHLFNLPGNVFVDNAIHLHLHWFYGRKLQATNPRLSRKQIGESFRPNQFYQFLPVNYVKARERWIGEEL